jgi:hypothetical protein
MTTDEVQSFLNILTFARDSLERRYYAKRDNLTLSSGDMPSIENLEAIPYPSDKDVMKLAKTLKKFIDSNP